MSRAEQRLHLADLAQLYVDIARRYDHSAILVLHPGAGGVSAFQELLEDIREKSGDAFCLLAHGDPTWAIPDGDTMMDFSIRMYEEPEAVSYTHLVPKVNTSGDIWIILQATAKINPTIRQSHRAGSTKPIVSFWTAALRDAVPPSARSG